MSIDELVPIRVQSVSGNPSLGWAEGMQFCLPKSVLQQSTLTKYLDTNGNLLVPMEGFGIDTEEVGTLRLRAAFTDRMPVSSRLPLSYQKIPSRVRSWMALMLGAWQRHKVNQWAAFPQWPLDLSADFLADLAGCPASPFKEGLTPVLLSHDLDSPQGLENLVHLFLDVEESMGARSTNYVVPCAWSIDHDLLEQVKDRGHEVGIHGYDHSNRTPFCSSTERWQRLAAARELIERYSIIGYRSPSLLRTRVLQRDLASFYRYDSSIPTSGGLFPVPNNGCASARPFYLEGIAELPISMPRDGSLRFLGYSSQEIFKIWVRCAEDISRSGGVVVLLTHCEERFSGNPPMLNAYRNFLEFVASSSRLTWSTPKELLEKALGTDFSEVKQNLYE